MSALPLVTVIGAALVFAWRRRRPVSPLDIALGTAIVAIALVACWGSGGLRSPAIVAVALALATATRALGRARSLAAVVIVFMALTAVHVLSGLSIEVTDLLAPFVLLAACGAANRVRRGAASASVGSAPARGLVARPLHADPAGALLTRVDPSNLRSDRVQIHDLAEGQRGIDLLSQHLGDVRDTWVAEEAVYWRWNTTGSELAPVSWSSADQREIPVDSLDEWRPLVEWAASERMINTDGADAPRLIAAPVATGQRSYGALSLSFPGGYGGDRARMRSRITRVSSHLARLVELLDAQQELARQTRLTSALLTAAQELQDRRSGDDYSAALCRTLLTMTGCTRASVVRWYGDRNEGAVQSVSAGNPVVPGLGVVAESYVGTMCRNGVPQLWETLPRTAPATAVFAPGEAGRAIGSLGVCPLTRDGSSIGALVVEDDAPGAFTTQDFRNVRLLAALATPSLETLWEVAEVTRRARTDELTGLANRRHFDEELVRFLAEADRYQMPVSLIVADIDHFKRVNDTYGHDAGDAVLRAVARVFADTVRTVDLCARFGGEEIAVLIKHTPVAGAADLAERLRAGIEQATVRVGPSVELRVTSSFGVAAYPDSVRSGDGLFAAADRALYRAKHDGRNLVRLAPAMAQQAAREGSASN